MVLLCLFASICKRVMNISRITYKLLLETKWRKLDLIVSDCRDFMAQGIFRKSSLSVTPFMFWLKLLELIWAD